MTRIGYSPESERPDTVRDTSDRELTRFVITARVETDSR
jgi:hypothetical protein